MPAPRGSPFSLSLVLFAVLLAGSGCGPSDATPAVSTTDTVAAGSTGADALLLAATRIALPPPGIAPADLAEPASPGALLVARYCAQCHELPSPTMHSATDWPRVVRRMWLRMDRLPDTFGIRTANEGERNTVLTYLMDNGLRVSGGELPSGRGREDFAAICSRCHALPDIRIHASGDWPAVFMRMERNMERMNVSPATREQTDNILFYLQKVAGRRSERGPA